MSIGIIAKIIKFLKDNKLLIVDHTFSPGKNSIFYTGGKELLDLLDPKLKRKKEVVARRDWAIKDYISKGFSNPTYVKECNCCKSYKEIIQFSIISKDPTNTHPVCAKCFRDNRAAANNSCREYHIKMKDEILFESYDEVADFYAKSQGNTIPDNVISIRSLSEEELRELEELQRLEIAELLEGCVDG